MSKIDKFHLELCKFVNVVLDQCEQSIAMESISAFLETKIDKDKLVKGFAEGVLPLKELVQKKDVSFFHTEWSIINNNEIVKHSVNEIKKVILTFDTNQLEIVWKWFVHLIKICESC